MPTVSQLRVALIPDTSALAAGFASARAEAQAAGAAAAEGFAEGTVATDRYNAALARTLAQLQALKGDQFGALKTQFPGVDDSELSKMAALKGEIAGVKSARVADAAAATEANAQIALAGREAVAGLRLQRTALKEAEAEWAKFALTVEASNRKANAAAVKTLEHETEAGAGGLLGRFANFGKSHGEGGHGGGGHEEGGVGGMLGTLGGFAGVGGLGEIAAPLAGIAGAGFAVHEAITRESQFAQIKKSLSGTPEELEKLKEELDKLGARVPIKYDDIYGIARSAAEAGISAQGITPFTETVGKLQVTLRQAGPELATQFAKILTGYHLMESDAPRLGSVLSALDGSFAASSTDVLTLTQRMGGLAPILGLTAQDVMALAAAVGSTGMPTQRAYMAMQQLFLGIKSGVDEGGPKLKQLAAITGTSADEFARLFKADPLVAFEKFTAGLDRTAKSGAPVSEFLKQMGFTGKQAIAVALTLADKHELLGKAIEKTRPAWKDITEQNRKFGEATDTTSGRLQIFFNRIAEIGDKLGTHLLPAFSGVLDVLNKILDAASSGPGKFLLGNVADSMGFPWLKGMLGGDEKKKAPGNEGRQPPAGDKRYGAAETQDEAGGGAPDLSAFKETAEDVEHFQSASKTLDAKLIDLNEALKGNANSLATLHRRYPDVSNAELAAYRAKVLHSQAIEKQIKLHDQHVEALKRTTDQFNAFIQTQKDEASELTTGSDKAAKFVAAHREWSAAQLIAGFAAQQHTEKIREQNKATQEFSAAEAKVKGEIADMNAALSGHATTIGKVRGEHEKWTAAQVKAHAATLDQAAAVKLLQEGAKKQAEALKHVSDALATARGNLAETAADIASGEKAWDVHALALKTAHQAYETLTPAMQGQIRQLSESLKAETMAQGIKVMLGEIRQLGAEVKDDGDKFGAHTAALRLFHQELETLPPVIQRFIKAGEEIKRIGEAVKMASADFRQLQAHLQDIGQQAPVHATALKLFGASLENLSPHAQGMAREFARISEEGGSLTKFSESMQKAGAELSLTANPFDVHNIAVKELGKSYDLLTDSEKRWVGVMADASRAVAENNIRMQAATEQRKATAQMRGDEMGVLRAENPGISDDTLRQKLRATNAQKVASTLDSQFGNGLNLPGFLNPQADQINAQFRAASDYVNQFAGGPNAQGQGQAMAMFQSQLTGGARKQFVKQYGDFSMPGADQEDPEKKQREELFKKKLEAVEVQKRDWLLKAQWFFTNTNTNFRQAADVFAKASTDAFAGFKQGLTSALGALNETIQQIGQNASLALASVGSGAVAGHRAGGGDVYGGSSYLVGERGPELFVPGASGSIVPNGALGGGGDIHVHQTIMTPNAVSFHQSRHQIAQDAHRMAEHVRSRNG